MMRGCMRMKTMITNYGNRYMIHMNGMIPKGITSYNAWSKKNKKWFQINNNYINHENNHNLKKNKRRSDYSSKLFSNVAMVPIGHSLTSGMIVEFRIENQLLLGIVESQNNKKWKIYDENGNVQEVRSQDITLMLPGNDYSRSDIVYFKQMSDNYDIHSIQVAWSDCSMNDTGGEQRKPMTLKELSVMLTGGDAPSQLYTAYKMLKNENAYFRQVGRNPPLYYRSSPDEVRVLEEHRKKNEEIRKTQLKFKEDVREVLLKPLKKRPLASYWIQGEHQKRIEALKEFALGDAPRIDYRNIALESLRVCGLSLTPNAAAMLLESIRIIDPHEPIALMRAGIEKEFSEEIEKEAKSMVENGRDDPDKMIRKDLRHLKVITIDDKGTKEIDDGLSIERLSNGKIKIWIHVSDPSRWIDFNSLISMEAKKRGLTLYTPTISIPVFPWILAKELFSLRKNIETCALSFGCILDENGDIDIYEIIPSIIKPSISLSYNEVKDSKDLDILTLMEIGAKRFLWRMKKGAVHFEMPKCDINVTIPNSIHNNNDHSNDDNDSNDHSNDGNDSNVKVTLVRNDESSPAYKMVAEMMILAGEIAGRIGIENKLILPYRSQIKPTLPTEEELRVLPDICKKAAIRKRMTPSNTSCQKAMKHSSLGVDAYVQVTSPIRRYNDYLAHLQLKAYLNKKSTCFSSAQLNKIVSDVTRNSRYRIKVAGDVNNYWIAEYFRQNRNFKIWNGIMLCWIREHEGLAAVLIDDIGLEIQMAIKRNIKSGEKLKLEFAGADVKNGRFKLEEIRKSKK